MKYRYILALDPSGAFKEGKGITGWCVLDAKKNKIIEASIVNSKDYSCQEEYWGQHITLLKELIKKYKSITVVIEDYRLYAHKAKNQINSTFETSKLIGILQQYCYNENIEYIMQLAATVKNRWTDHILVHKNYIIKKGKGYSLPDTDKVISKHTKDAIRHAVHYATFLNK